MRAWPFPVAKPEAEWTEFDREYIDLLRTAFAEGYNPREDSCSCVELGRWPVGRSVSLVYRGFHNGWESFLGEYGASVRLGPLFGLPLGEYACVCVRPPFRAAAHLALEWMRGRSLESLLVDFRFVGGYPPGIELRPEVVPLVHLPRERYDLERRRWLSGTELDEVWDEQDSQAD